MTSIWGTGRPPKRSAEVARRMAREFAIKHGIPVEVLMRNDPGRKGTARAARGLRNACWSLIHEKGNVSLPQIGQAFGGLHHTTVLYGIRQHRKAMEPRA